MNNALKGARILVTRPENQAETLCQLIEQQGGIPIRFPTLQIVDVDDQGNNLSSVTNPLTGLHSVHWLIFTSANAVNFALIANGGKIAQLKSAQIAAIGQATAKALQLAGFKVNLIPIQGYDSESLLAMPQLQDVNGRDICIVRGQGGREELANVLRARGANVSYWEVYKRVAPICDCSQVTGLLENGKLDAVIITSFEALQNLMNMVGEKYQSYLSNLPLVVISDRISRLAGKMGFMRIAVTEYQSDQAVLDTAIKIINERG